jgi:hypothetical protein
METLCEGPYCANRMTQPKASRCRRFCSPACRQAAYRRRRNEIVWEPLDGAGVEPVVAITPESTPRPDDAVAGAIIEARTLAGAFTNLGRCARPQFAWRCTKMGEAIHSALDDYFEG